MKNFIKTISCIALIFGLAACSEGVGNTAGGTSEEAEGIIAITNKTIAGVSQKGPFATGSKVVLKETRGTSFTTTGKEFFANIRNDKGEFKIDGINLESQYVLLAVTGFYQSETTGNYSGCEISLNAASDISDREQANINILTHLEHSRILYLINKKGKSYTDAKTLAHKELMENFNYQGLVEDSENLDITSNSEADSALLKISSFIDYWLDSFHTTVLNTPKEPEKSCTTGQIFVDKLASKFASSGKIKVEEKMHIIEDEDQNYIFTTFFNDLLLNTFFY